MAGEQIPRAWIGEEVDVLWTGEGDAYDFVLLDVVPEGIVVEAKTTEERGGTTYEATSHSLIPWTAISWVQRFVRLKEIDAQDEDAG